MRRKLLLFFIPAVAATLRLIGTKKSIGRRRTDGRSLTVRDRTAGVTENYLLYVMIPLWVVTGLLDYIWHRKTSIETTSGVTESAIHALMMTEAGLPMVLGLFLEINAGVILLMIAAFFAHAATAIWDVAFAVARREVTPNEQHTHSFLEVLPFCAVSFVICLHSAQFLALFGAGSEKPRFELKRKNPPLPRSYIVGMLGGVAINASAYGEELVRCIRAKNQGLEGVDSPEAARRLYGK